MPGSNTRQFNSEYEAQKLRNRALRLRLSGWGYRAIAAHLGRDLKTVHSYVMMELRKIPKEAADELRAIECARLDEMAAGIRTSAKSGDPKAILAAIKISERRSRLLGLDAPALVSAEVSLPGRIEVVLVESVLVEGDK